MDGDTVLVGPGTYVENIRFLGRDIALVSRAGPEVTVLDGRGAASSVVQITNGETRQASLVGFTITGGTGSEIPGWGGGGGGVVIIDSEPTIRGNVIFENAATRAGTRYGGGIYCVGRTLDRLWLPVITDNNIRANRAESNGGGIGIANSVSPTITANTLLENITDQGDGGAFWVWVHSPSTAVVARSNTVRRNSAGDHGGGMYIGTSTGATVNVDVSFNLIDNNSAFGRELAESSGGGIWLGHCAGRVHNNTVVRNVGAEFLQGGGITTFRSSLIEIDHNIVAFTLVSGGIVCVNGEGVIHDNLAWMNADGDGVGDCREWTNSGGNVVADPMFCDMTGDNFAVAKGSPALSHEGGAIGAFAESGCEGVAVQCLTWGLLKTIFR